MNKVAFLTLAVILLSCAWVAVGPFRTMQAIERAANENNPDLLDRNVDFPVLRQSLKGQLGPKVAEKLNKETGEKRWGALGALYSDQIADVAVDALITPQGIATLLNAERRKKKKKKKHSEASTEGAAQPGNTKQPTEKEWNFHSVNEFAMDVKKGDKVTSFIVTRYGLGWKLTDIILP